MDQSHEQSNKHLHDERSSEQTGIVDEKSPWIGAMNRHPVDDRMTCGIMTYAIVGATSIISQLRRYIYSSKVPVQ